MQASVVGPGPAYIKNCKLPVQYPGHVVLSTVKPMHIYDGLQVVAGFSIFPVFTWMGCLGV